MSHSCVWARSAIKTGRITDFQYEYCNRAGLSRARSRS